MNTSAETQSLSPAASTAATTGRRLSAMAFTSASSTMLMEAVVRYFAVLHDCMRRDDATTKSMAQERQNMPSKWGGISHWAMSSSTTSSQPVKARPLARKKKAINDTIDLLGRWQAWYWPCWDSTWLILHAEEAKRLADERDMKSLHEFEFVSLLDG